MRIGEILLNIAIGFCSAYMVYLLIYVLINMDLFR